MAKNTDEKVTYVLTLKSGALRRVEVPAHWKITFGALIPYTSKSSYSSTPALRFYEGNKENLRAVFTDVESFRVLGDMQITERRTDVQRKVVQRQDAGGLKNVIVEARTTEWLDPDDEEAGAEKAAPYVGLIESGDE